MRVEQGVAWVDLPDNTFRTATPGECAARIAELEAEIGYVRKKLAEYVQSNFDPGMMGPTLDDIRHHLKIEST